MVLGYKFFRIASLGLAFLLLCCTQFERDNPNDENGINYMSPSASSSSSYFYSSSSSNRSSSSYFYSSSSSNRSSSSSAGGYTGSYGSVYYEGQTYKTVNIGGQVWFAENLNYEVSGSKCYNNDSSNCTTYGRLYNWSTAKTVCPSGWHLPSDAEWTLLENAVGGSGIAGTKLKATSGWYNNGNGTDDYGFSALPGGDGNSDGSFGYVGGNGYWWSAAEYDAAIAYHRDMFDSRSDVTRDRYYKSALFSVRCLQD